MKRILRVIEYTGTDEFLSACIERRQVKGTMTVPNGCIREAILGDVPEILSKYTDRLAHEQALAGEGNQTP